MIKRKLKKCHQHGQVLGRIRVCNLTDMEMRRFVIVRQSTIQEEGSSDRKETGGAKTWTTAAKETFIRFIIEVNRISRQE